MSALTVDGDVEVRCTLAAAWDLFTRFGDVAELIPTVEEVEVDGDTVYARVETKLGILPISSRVTLQVTDRKPNCCLKAEGVSYLGETIRDQVSPNKEIQGIDKDSTGRLSLHLDLRPAEAQGAITISYSAEVEAYGRLKRIYRSILKTKVPGMMKEFAENLRTELEAGDEVGSETENAAPAAGEAEAAALSSETTGSSSTTASICGQWA